MKIIAFHAARAKKPAPRRRRRRRNFRPLIVLAAALLVLFAIGMGVRALFFGERWGRAADPADQVTYIGTLPVHEDFVDASAVGRPGGNRTIRYVVIHETDNFAAGADAERHNEFIHQNVLSEKLSWHYTVDDHEAYHHVPDDEPAYHAGDGDAPDGGNRCGIGVELCVAEDNDYEKTLQNGALLAAYLLDRYDLGLDALRKHQDFSGKVCPARLIEQGRWDEFCEMVRQNYEKFQQN